MEWLFLFLAISFEIAATTFMKLSYGFTKLLPTIGTFLGYIFCFTFLSIALKKLDISIAYAIWSAVGIVVISTIGVFIFKENFNPLKILSMFLIVLGVIGLNLSGINH